MFKKASIFVVVLILAGSAEASWKPLQAPAPRIETRCVWTSPSDPALWMAGGKGGARLTRDGGKSWKQVLRLPGGVSVNSIAGGEDGSIFAGTDEGLYVSGNGISKWRRIFSRPEAAEETIACVVVTAESDIAVGTAAGLFVSPDAGLTWHRVPAFADRAVYQIEAAGNGRYLASSSRGLFLSAKGFAGWRSLYRKMSPAAEEASGASEGESIAIEPDAMYFALISEEPMSVLLVNGREMLRSRDALTAWERATAQLSSRVSAAPVRLPGSEGTLLVPSLKGAYWVSPDGSSARPAGTSLGSLPVYGLHYDAKSDTLLAAAGSGLFAMTHPEANAYWMIRDGERTGRVSGVLERFAHEPTIQELQTVAMRYAEVHPEKIAEWRAAAARKPWLPSLGFGRDWATNQNVDIDRGGTGDPDQFIFGPAERSADYSVDVSWDLSEILWSDDQTAIDNRSKLMVQLRDDLLNQLNHLYFARRRLQVETALRGGADLKSDIETELQLQEYAAGIDALTGGWFSERLAQSPRVEIRSSER